MTESQWRSDLLDLDAYLSRIGYAGPRAATPEVLRALHRAHLAAIAFENLDVILGRGVAVDLPSVQAKLVDAGRGGYCYEHGTLFAAALEQMGFSVDRLLVRTGDPLVEPRPRTHLTLKVTNGDGPWLADVGFGSGLLEPVPLRSSPPLRQGAWQYRLTLGPDGAWRLAEDDGTGWRTLQTITEEPVYPIDVERANWTTSTHPHSPFVNRIICVRKDDRQVQRLLGRTYSVERPGRPAVVRDLDDGTFAVTVRREFGLDLTEDDIAALLSFNWPEAAAGLTASPARRP